VPNTRTKINGVDFYAFTKQQIIDRVTVGLEMQTPASAKMLYLQVYRPLADYVFNPTQLATNAPTLDEIMAAVSDAKKPALQGLRQWLIATKQLMVLSGLFAGDSILKELMADATPFTPPA